MEKMLKNAVLGFFRRGNAVLLARKSRNIGAGCWNGYGGGIEEGETPETALVREIFQECSVTVDSRDLEKVAVLDACNLTDEGEEFLCRVHTYFVRNWQGEPVESEEMLTPIWFMCGGLPLDEMMPADRIWVPRILSGERIHVKAWYGPRQRVLLRDVEIHDLPAELL